jgi:hypothetical protein
MEKSKARKDREENEEEKDTKDKCTFFIDFTFYKDPMGIVKGGPRSIELAQLFC